MTPTDINRRLARAIGYRPEDVHVSDDVNALARSLGVRGLWVRANPEAGVWVSIRDGSAGTVKALEKFYPSNVCVVYMAPGFFRVKKVWDEALWRAAWEFHEKCAVSVTRALYERCALAVIEAKERGLL